MISPQALSASSCVGSKTACSGVMVKRKDGPVERWIAQVVVDGRKRRVTALTEAAATKELRRLLRSIDDGKPIADGNLTLGALLTEWDSKVLAGRDISGSTLMRHRWALGILRAELGSTRVRTLTPGRVESALAARADAGLSRASLEKVRGTLSQVLNWAIGARSCFGTSPRSSNCRRRRDQRRKVARSRSIRHSRSSPPHRGRPSKPCGRPCSFSVSGPARRRACRDRTST